MTCYFCKQYIDQKEPWGTFVKEQIYEYFHASCSQEWSIKVEAKKICDDVDAFLERHFPENKDV